MNTNTHLGSKHWYEEFGVTLRFPRPPCHELTKLLKSIQEPTVFLRDGDKGVEIVVRLHSWSGTHLSKMKKQLMKSGFTLSRTFEDILWNKLGAGKNTTWAELARPALEAYRQTWLHFFELIYLGHFHPQADAWLKTIKNGIDSASKAADRGRPSTTQAEVSSLNRRHVELLALCKFIHGAAEEVLLLFQKSTDSLTPSKLRREIWKRVQPSVHGMPGDGYILSGKAFERIPYGKKGATLHNPISWNPRQLAIALLSFERMQAYQTIEKKIARTKRKSNERPL
jgi:hypothetical protein